MTESTAVSTLPRRLRLMRGGVPDVGQHESGPRDVLVALLLDGLYMSWVKAVTLQPGTNRCAARTSA